MKKFGLGFRFYVFYFLVVSVIAWMIVDKSIESVDESLKQASEEVMIDTANLLAEIAAKDVQNNQINIRTLAPLIDRYLKRTLHAQIYSLYKNKPTMQLYITDVKGKVLYDSTGWSTDKDYSHWRDVSYTLRGQYGARSSLYEHEHSPNLIKERAIYVAAPIFSNANTSDKKDIIGVLTIYKSINNLNNFIQHQATKITNFAILVFIISLFFGAIFTWVLSQSIRKLVHYANTLADGKKIDQPIIDQEELQALSAAIKRMRIELDGKEYVENYIHTMAHELKTPITGIQSSAELLLEPMPEKQQQHFTQHILDSTTRMTLLIERLLQLARLERQNELENIEAIDLNKIIKSCVKSREISLMKKNIHVDFKTENDAITHADGVLIEQAIANLLDNAIEFSLANSTIHIILTHVSNTIKLVIIDEGTGIPDYAMTRLFERFFSLSRPASNKRSTGLGLRFVQEIMELHQGKITVENYEEDKMSGVKAILQFP
ncbi:MAG: two-component system sensor histidine kinase CreC [Methylococcales bacterium]|nr:two-component system sensor histidine kinase CreC [Methylococcales bacterium]